VTKKVKRKHRPRNHQPPPPPEPPPYIGPSTEIDSEDWDMEFCIECGEIVDPRSGVRVDDILYHPDCAPLARKGNLNG
jgi:hypothetical protein